MSSYDPCVCCDKPVRVDRAHWRVELDDRGEEATDYTPPEHRIGWHAVGSTCRHKYTCPMRFEPLEVSR